MPPPSNGVGQSRSNGQHPSALPRCAPLNGGRLVRFETTVDATRRSRNPPRILEGTQNHSGSRRETALPLHGRFRQLIQRARYQRKRDPPGFKGLWPTNTKTTRGMETYMQSVCPKSGNPRCQSQAAMCPSEKRKGYNI